MPGRFDSVVVGIGAATWDDLWLVDAFADREQVAQAAGHVAQGGGPVATALCILGQLGHRAALIDVCGDDGTGRHIRDSLEACGVNSGFIEVVHRTRSATAVVLVRRGDGARQIIFQPSDAGEPHLSPAAQSLIHRASLLHLNGRHEGTAREAVRLAKERGVPISFDGGAGRHRESIRDLVEASQIRIVARDFARHFTATTDVQQMGARLLETGACIVAITDGLRGSHVWSADGESFHQPAYAAHPRAVDSTGCGDVFHGAFLHGWLRGWTIRQCAEFASRAAALNAEGLGGRFICLERSAALAELAARISNREEPGPGSYLRPVPGTGPLGPTSNQPCPGM